MKGMRVIVCGQGGLSCKSSKQILRDEYTKLSTINFVWCGHQSIEKKYFMDNNDNDLLALTDNLRIKKQEAKDTVQELKKMYSNLKIRVKRYEKKVAALDEQEEKMFIMVVMQNVQYALNKFERIERNIALCRTHLQYLEKQFKDMQMAIPYGRVKEISYNFSAIFSRFGEPAAKAGDDIRIANKHLNKIVEYIMFLSRINRVPKRWKGE